VIRSDEIELKSSPLVFFIGNEDLEIEGAEPGSGLIKGSVLELIADVILNGVYSNEYVGRGSSQ
jgi:hypothetical protein